MIERRAERRALLSTSPGVAISDRKCRAFRVIKDRSEYLAPHGWKQERCDGVGGHGMNGWRRYQIRKQNQKPTRYPPPNSCHAAE